MRIGVRKADDHNGPIDDFLIDIALFDLISRQVFCEPYCTVAILPLLTYWCFWVFYNCIPNHRHFAIIILAWGPAVLAHLPPGAPS